MEFNIVRMMSLIFRGWKEDFFGEIVIIIYNLNRKKKYNFMIVNFIWVEMFSYL